MGWESIIGAGISSIANWMLTDYNNQRADARTERDRALNHYYNEASARNADARTRALYADFYSPEALTRQYNEAGLSPSLMFGGTPGQGGMSGAQGNGAAGIQTPYYPYSLVEAAQAANLFAQAQKTKAETKTIEGENERGLAEIAKLWKENGYIEVNTALTAEQITNQQWQNYITSSTAEGSINTAYALADAAANNAIRGTYEIISAQVKAHVDEATAEAQIEQAMQNIKYTEAQTLLARSGIKLNEANTARATAEISKWQQEVAIGWKKLYNDMYNAQTQRQMWRTIDEQMERSMKVLEERLSFDKDLGEKKFLWMIVNDTYNNILGTMNTVAPTKAN